MAAFRFSLQLLLDRRTAREAEKRTRLLSAERAASRESAAVVALEAQLRALGSGFALDERADPSVLRQTLVELDLVRSALGARQNAAAVAGERLRAAREDYIAARREREQVQSLRERAYTTYLAAQERREASEHDEANARGRTLSP